MKRFIKHAGSVVLVSLAMQAMPASAARLGVTMATFDNNFLTILRNNMKSYAASQKGVNLQLEDAQNDVGRQISQVQNFIAQKVDAIVVSAVDTSTTPKITKLAQAAGIPLVFVNRMPTDKTLPPKVAFVGSDDSVSGTIQMKEVCRQLNGKGSVVIMMGDLATQEARLRTRYAEEVMAKAPCNGIKVVEKQTAKWSRTEGRDLVMNWMTAGLKFDAVVANNDEMALGAIQALRSSGKLDKTVVAGIDATQDALNAMKTGEMKVTVFQDAAAQGKGAVDAAIKLAAGEKVPSMIWVPYELVTAANYKSYQSRN
ncbi:sugar ABC transporter substrate-binding protein [Vogesella indigofera]|uniref:sugar ABC transporter substrate-binding protein n=1 Tax=Vogesella indigofera TaxID=45465 RepID=UPI00234E72DC|nr:sugar ABC transporter substrate-binding protein [Vogesella indigofera]MDC7696468.1 sugar ABC transporter substrate-binding protein [Vogesella indigofera]